ncbi:hypothetical protein [Sorangium sp. So ce1099]
MRDPHPSWGTKPEWTAGVEDISELVAEQREVLRAGAPQGS